MIAEGAQPKERAGSTASLAAYMGWLTAVVIGLLYVPVLIDIQPLWHNERGGHCIFIVPLAIALAWLRRDLFRPVESTPDSRGLWLAGAGLLLEACSYLMRLSYFEAYSLPLVIAGFVLLRYGARTLRIALFPILLLVFVVPFPFFVINPISQWISRVSADGSVKFVEILGYPITQQGNILQIPGVTVVVADVCSGFNKLSILFLMSLVYGDMFPLSRSRRVLLTLASLPISILANVLRITIILLVSIYSGAHGLHVVHDWAELMVVTIAFFLFVGLGAYLGCKRPRFSI